MKFSVHAENFGLLKAAAKSICDSVRFGPEFCEVKIPTQNILKKTYELARREEKEFIYVTPRLSNRGIDKIRKQLALLNDLGSMRIVVNDLGILNFLDQYPNLQPHLGRQLAFVPARCPWSNEIIDNGGLLARRWVRKVFASTSLNYKLTVNLYQTYGVKNADVDWIPCIFPCFYVLVEMGFSLSVHLHFVPVTISRRCHTARFLGEKTPEACSKQCFSRAFLLENDAIKSKLFLHGNVVFRRTESSKNIKKMKEVQVAEIVMSMNPITMIESTQKLNETIQSLRTLAIEDL
jgi:collagenase-like PrtC family protease